MTKVGTKQIQTLHGPLQPSTTAGLVLSMSNGSVGFLWLSDCSPSTSPNIPVRYMTLRNIALHCKKAALRGRLTSYIVGLR